MSLSVAAPVGAEFQMVEFKKRGSPAGVTAPRLVWNDAAAVLAFYGEEAVRASHNGASFGAQYDNIIRRLIAKGKTGDEIATAQVAYRPGQRVGAQKPETKLKRSMKRVAEKIGPERLAELLAKIDSGEIKIED